MIKELELFLESGEGHFLLLGRSKEALNKTVLEIRKKFKYKINYVKNEREENDCLNIFYLDNNKHSLIYYYLENNFTLFLSTDSTCIRKFEKRNKSRFNNKIAFLNEELETYKIDINFICSHLTNLHFVLLCLISKKDTNAINIYTDFKKYGVKEQLNVHMTSVISAYYDLVEFGFVEKGRLATDYEELSDYIRKNCPIYIKSLL